MSDKPLTDIAFSSFDLHPALQAGLEAAGFTRCTPIQALTLPIALAGRDVAGQAHVKTGYLDGARALAGYVLDRRGRRAVVVFLANHPNAGATKAAQDALLACAWERSC